MGAKKRNGTPRRHQFRRKQRLESAKAWLPTFGGKKLFQAYRKRYGVDWATALKELEMLGIQVDPAYREAVLRSAQAQTEQKRRKRLERSQQADSVGWPNDDHFAVIIGYTSGGAPYGITWDEWQENKDDDPLPPGVDIFDK